MQQGSATYGATQPRSSGAVSRVSQQDPRSSGAKPVSQQEAGTTASKAEDPMSDQLADRKLVRSRAVISIVCACVGLVYVHVYYWAQSNLAENLMAVNSQAISSLTEPHPVTSTDGIFLPNSAVAWIAFSVPGFLTLNIIACTLWVVGSILLIRATNVPVVSDPIGDGSIDAVEAQTAPTGAGSIDVAESDSKMGNLMGFIGTLIVFLTSLVGVFQHAILFCTLDVCTSLDIGSSLEETYRRNFLITCLVLNIVVGLGLSLAGIMCIKTATTTLAKYLANRREQGGLVGINKHMIRYTQ